MFDIRKLQEQTIYDAVKAASDDNKANFVVYGENREAVSEDAASWVPSTMARLEQCFDKPTIKTIRMACQCGYGMEEKIELVQKLFSSVSNSDEFSELEAAKKAGLFIKNEELYLQFPFCPCPMLAEVERLNSDSWCQCTTGYSTVLFEKALGCSVEVELIKSVKMGDDICLMKIIPSKPIW